MLNYFDYIFWTITIVQIVIFLFWINVLGYVKIRRTKIYYIILIILLLSSSFLMNSRFLFLAGILSVLFIEKVAASKIKYALSYFLLFAIISLLFIKSSSSSGRILIYKLCASSISNKNLFSHDSTPFNLSLNHIQAAYFRKTGTNNNDALVANNVYYAFNEWLEFAVRFGVIGILSSIFFLTFIAKIYLSQIQAKHVNLETLWLALLLPILISSFVSYPFHNHLIAMESMCFLLLIMSKHIFRNRITYGTLQRLQLILVAIAIVGIFILIFEQKIENYKISKVEQLINEGQKNNAETKIKENFKIPEDKYITPLYANLEYVRGNVKNAIHLLIAHHQYQCNSAFHSLLGQWFLEINDSTQAENNFLDAFYIVPGKLSSRYDLMAFYAHYGNLEKARYWANDLITFPIKIENANAFELKRKAQYFIENNKIEP